MVRPRRTIPEDCEERRAISAEMQLESRPELNTSTVRFRDPRQHSLCSETSQKVGVMLFLKIKLYDMATPQITTCLSHLIRSSSAASLLSTSAHSYMNIKIDNNNEINYKLENLRS